MSKIPVTVEVSKEAYELGKALVAIVQATRQALKDGFQPGSDVPAVIMASIRELPAALLGVDQLSVELAEDKAAFIKAFALAGFDLAEKP